VRPLVVAVAMALAGCAAPIERVAVPDGFSPALCEVGPRGYPRPLSLDELKLCARYNPVTGGFGHSVGGQMFHTSAWGKAFDLAPVPVRGW
jgi:hypothetical protein